MICVGINYDLNSTHDVADIRVDLLDKNRFKSNVISTHDLVDIRFRVEVFNKNRLTTLIVS